MQVGGRIFYLNKKKNKIKEKKVGKLGLLMDDGKRRTKHYASWRNWQAPALFCFCFGAAALGCWHTRFDWNLVPESRNARHSHVPRARGIYISPLKPNFLIIDTLITFNHIYFILFYLHYDVSTKRIISSYSDTHSIYNISSSWKLGLVFIECARFCLDKFVGHMLIDRSIDRPAAAAEREKKKCRCRERKKMLL